MKIKQRARPHISFLFSILSMMVNYMAIAMQISKVMILKKFTKKFQTRALWAASPSQNFKQKQRLHSWQLFLILPASTYPPSKS
jgi:hypothetical protein